MRWIIKRLFWLGVLVALFYYGSQYKIDGKTIKEYAQEFYRAPLVQAVLKTGKEVAQEFWEKKVGDKEAEKKGDQDVSVKVESHLTDEDQKALNRVLDTENQ